MGSQTNDSIADVSNLGWTITGGSLLNVVLQSTSSDTAYISNPAGSGGAMIAFPKDVSIPAGAIVTSVSVLVRAATGANIGSVDPAVPACFTLDVVTADNTSKRISRSLFPTSTITTYTLGTFTRDASGAQWDIERLNHTYLKVRASLGVSDAVRVYRMYLVINYKLPPTVSVTSPTGTVSTPAPALAWVYNQSDGDPLGSVQYKLFSQSQVSATSFDPNMTPPVFKSTLSGDIQGLTLPYALPSDTYWLYVQVTSVYGVSSAWVGRQFTVYSPTPGTPGDVLGASAGVVSVVEDDTAGNVEISITNTSNLLSAQSASSANIYDAPEYVTTNCTFAQDTTTSFGNSEFAAWKLTPSSSATASVAGFWIEVQPGTPFTERVQFKAATAGKSCQAIAQFADSTFTYLSANDIAGTTVTDVTTGWVESVVTGTVPLTANYIRVVPTVLSATSGQAHWVDHLGIMYGANSPYTDGGMNGRNMLSSWYATAEGTAPPGQSWTAASGCTADTTSITGIGNTTHRLTYNGVSPSIALRATGSAFSTTSSGTNYTLNRPAGVLTGDLMIAFVSSSGTGGIHVPSGWTLVAGPQASTSNGNVSLWVMKRTAGGSEPSSWTDGYLTTSSAERYAVVVAYSGAADVSTQFIADSSSQSAASSPTYVTNPLINNTDSNAWRVSAFAVDSPTSGGTLTSNQASPQEVPITFVGASPPWRDGGGWSSSPPFTMPFQINKPVGVQSGDLMVAAFTFTGAGNYNTTQPAGWTIAGNTSGGGTNTTIIMVRTAGASEPTSWQGSITTGSLGTRSGARIVSCVAYRGASNASLQFVPGYIAANGVIGGSSASSPSLSNVDSSNWRISIFSADSSHSGIFNATTEQIARANSNVYTTIAQRGSDSVSLLVADSNGAVATGSYSTTAWWESSQDAGFGSAVAFEGFIRSAHTTTTPGANETSRITGTIGAANPFLTTGVFDSNAVVSSGTTQTTGTFTPGSGSVVNAMVGWNGMIRPATPQPAGVAAMTMATLIDISNVDPAVLELCGNQVTIVAHVAGAATGGNPYLVANFYRANVPISSAIGVGAGFGVYPTWRKSSATFDIPEGTTRIGLTLEVDGRPVSDAVYFKRISLAFGSDPTYRTGTAQATQPVWEIPQIEFSEDAGEGFTDWAALQGSLLNPPQYDCLSATATYFDETIVPLTPRKYRVRTLVYGLQGDQFVSPWSSETAPVVFNGSGIWWLKDLETGNKLALKVKFEDFAVDTTGTAMSFQPLGEDFPIVVTEGYKTDTLKPTLRPVNRADWILLNDMLRSGNTLFLQSDYDSAWWVRALSDINHSVLASNMRQSNPIRDVTITFLQVAPEA